MLLKLDSADIATVRGESHVKRTASMMMESEDATNNLIVSDEGQDVESNKKETWTNSTASVAAIAAAATAAGAGTLRCHHCLATTSPMWRRTINKKHYLCNACGLYLRKYGKRRLCWTLPATVAASNSATTTTSINSNSSNSLSRIVGGATNANSATVAAAAASLNTPPASSISDASAADCYSSTSSPCCTCSTISRTQTINHQCSTCNFIPIVKLPQTNFEEQQRRQQQNHYFHTNMLPSSLLLQQQRQQLQLQQLQHSNKSATLLSPPTSLFICGISTGGGRNGSIIEQQNQAELFSNKTEADLASELSLIPAGPDSLLLAEFLF